MRTIKLLSLQGVLMTIREATAEDLQSIKAVCISSFMESVAPTLEEEGVKTFQGVASVTGLKSRMVEDNEMIVYEDNHEIVGFLELKEGRHIAMLFVSPKFQNKGVGKSLIVAMCEHARSDVITVSASLTSVSAYLGYGFENAGVASESAGLKYQPMEMKLNKAIKNRTGQKTASTGHANARLL